MPKNITIGRWVVKKQWKMHNVICERPLMSSQLLRQHHCGLNCPINSSKINKKWTNKKCQNLLDFSVKVAEYWETCKKKESQHKILVSSKFHMHDRRPLSITFEHTENQNTYPQMKKSKEDIRLYFTIFENGLPISPPRL